MKIKCREKEKDINKLLASEILLVYDIEYREYKYERYNNKDIKEVSNKGLKIELTNMTVILPSWAKVINTEFQLVTVKDLKVGDMIMRYRINNIVSDLEAIEVKSIVANDTKETFYKLNTENMIIVDKLPIYLK